MKERGNLQIHFEKGQTLPEAGEKIHAYGFAGTYEVSIHRIKKTILHDDGSISLVVHATRRIIEEATSESEVRRP